MKAILKNRELVNFYNWAAQFLRRPNGIDNAFKRSVNFNVTEIEPLVTKYQNKHELIRREYASTDKDDSIRKVPSGRKIPTEGKDKEGMTIMEEEMVYHYTRKNEERMISETQALADAEVEVEVYPLSKITSVPKSIAKDFIILRAIKKIVITEEMAKELMYDFKEDVLPVDDEEKTNKT